MGVALFLRHTRAVELTSAGAQLQRAVGPALERMDAAVRLVRLTMEFMPGNSLAAKGISEQDS